MAAETLTPDLCVIGAGSGGVRIAIGAALAGVAVVLVERGRPGGGHGRDLASKALVAAARRAAAVREGADFGVDAGAPKIDYARFCAHAEAVVAEAALNDSEARLAALGIKIVRGAARFRNAQTVVAGETKISAKRFVIATGSAPMLPDIPGLAAVPHLTGDTLLGLRTLPTHLLVLGAGATGIELAQAFRRLGAAVTVLESVTPLSGEDQECAAAALAALERDGVVVRAGVDVRRIERQRKTIRAILAGADGEETVAGSHLLVAVGRRANVEELGLEAAGIAFDRRGIHVGPNLKTTNRRAFAIGDVIGTPQYTQAAAFHAGLVLGNILFRRRIDVRRAAIPRVVFTDPELAHVGLGEDDARLRHGAIRVLRWPYAENDRARVERAAEGMVKVVTTRRGRIVGASLVGAGAGELVGYFALAIDKRMTARSLAALNPPALTYAEIVKQVAGGALWRDLTNPWVRRIIRLLRIR
jgi:pyruvate/2-oxoglutarate dehydrogenase complex dihydrolipoamide dehydrogenase (E3) component